MRRAALAGCGRTLALPLRVIGRLPGRVADGVHDRPNSQLQRIRQGLEPAGLRQGPGHETAPRLELG